MVFLKLKSASFLN